MQAITKEFGSWRGQFADIKYSVNIQAKSHKKGFTRLQNRVQASVEND